MNSPRQAFRAKLRNNPVSLLTHAASCAVLEQNHEILTKDSLAVFDVADLTKVRMLPSELENPSEQWHTIFVQVEPRSRSLAAVVMIDDRALTRSANRSAAAAAEFDSLVHDHDVPSDAIASGLA